MSAHRGPFPAPRRAERGGILLWLLAGLGVIALLVAGYFYIAVHWSYSEGERSGVLQKLSRKGWMVKTWEGELAMSTVPGVAPVIWNFTVRDPAAAKKVSAALGKQVVLHYTEHRGLPGALFGDTRYFVDDVRVTGSGPAASAMPEM
jgi:hypothetical protein